MVHTRRNPGRGEGMADGNPRIIASRRGRGGNRRSRGGNQRGRGGGLQDGGGRVSARDRLGSRVDEEASGHQQSCETLPSPRTEARHEEDRRHQQLQNVHTEVVQNVFPTQPAAATGMAQPSNGASMTSPLNDLIYDQRLVRTTTATGHDVQQPPASPSSGSSSTVRSLRDSMLDQWKFKREGLRRRVKELEEELQKLLQDGRQKEDLTKVKLSKMEEKLEEIRSLDRRIAERLCGAPNQLSATLDAELKEADLVQESAECIKLAVLEGAEADREKTTSRNDRSEDQRKLPLKIPKHEVSKFDGDIENWPSWWGQFRILHESDQIATVHKFQLLLQSMKEGSSAQNIIKHLPLEEKFYEEAIEALKRRFGNRTQLIDALVQGVISLINEASAGRMDFVDFYDKIKTKLKTIETLGPNALQQCQYLHTQLIRALPVEIRSKWEHKKMDMEDSGMAEDTNQLDELMKLLDREVRFLEQERRLKGVSLGAVEVSFVPTAANLVATSATSRPNPNAVAIRAANGQGKGKKNELKDKAACLFCGKGHPSVECWSAAKMVYQEKISKIRKAGCCFICLKFGHQARHCRSQVSCTNCGKRHHAIICKGQVSGKGLKKGNAGGSQQQGFKQPDRKVEWTNAPASRPRAQPDRRVEISHDDEKEEITAEDLKKVKRTVNCIGTTTGGTVRLQTVLTILEGPKGRRLCRAVLDTGAQKSSATREVIEAVGLQQKASFTTQHNLYGGRTSKAQKHGIYVGTIASQDGSFSLPISIMDEKKIIDNLPTINVKTAGRLRELGIELTDFGAEKPVDLLLGNDVFGLLLTGESKRVKVAEDDQFVTALKTYFGWVVSGDLGVLEESEIKMAALMGTLSVNQMFDLEVIGIKDPIQTKSKKELQEDIKSYFLQTFERYEDGRYVVEWPWTMSRQLLPNNYQMALARLKSAAKKLHEMGVYDQYGEVIKSWCAEDIIEEVPAENWEAEGYHYLPHRGVLKMDSLTTKLRPVFDASAKTSRTYSLNDLLAKGPNMLELIPDLIMRFMTGQVAAVSDIKKAFLQIELKPDQRDVVRFLWYDEDQKSIRVFRHKRVVFGVNCSPFLLAAVLEKHLKDCPEDQKKTADKLLESLYVDNCVASFNTVGEYVNFKEQSVKLLAEAQFDLRLWEDNLETNPSSTTTKVLGIKWNKKADTLSPYIVKIKVPEQMTKKTLLSVSHSLFDPTGMFAPVALVPKLLLRETCELGLQWDDILPEDIQKKFAKWCNEMTLLETVSIPRPMAKVNQNEGSWSLHVFCDASKLAFATVVFVRVETADEVTVRFLQARTRLAPIREDGTIPRKELLAGLTGARLGTSIKKALRVNWPVTYWTDSKTVLQWIQSNEIWGVFVDNRVKEIRSLTSIADWRHVPGRLNPADAPSRGLSSKKFLESRWLQGPDWLKEKPEHWPTEVAVADGFFNDENGERNYHMEAYQEKQKTATLAATSKSVDEDFADFEDIEQDQLQENQLWYERGQTYSEVIRNLAQELKSSDQQMEVDHALEDQQDMDIDQQETAMVIDSPEEQLELSSEDLKQAELQAWRWIQQEAKVSDKQTKPLKIEQKNGLWRVNTRLSFLEDSGLFMWPVYLPKDHPLVQLLIKETHERLSHAGAATVMAELRKRVWIQHSRKTIIMVISRCVTCRIHHGKKLTAIEAPLPKKRLSMGRVFEVTGVDYGGPLYTRSGEKVYFALFTCATYRAVHLEMVGDATTEAFMQAFRRFRNRRGNPVKVCSDNGTNFRGYDNLINKIDWKKLQTEFEADRIEWDFNPPAAPWWGGFWERLVGIVKSLLRKILGNKVLDKEELRTALTDVEMVVNSRPLTYLAEHDDLVPLTPNSFLMDFPWAETVDMDQMEEDGFQKRYQFRLKLREELRQRFRLEYSGSLKSMVTAKNSDELKINDVVLIEVDNKRRLAWPIGIVVELFPGRDGVVRLVKVKTQTGEMLRPIQRLVKLGSELLPEQDKQVKEIAKKSFAKEPIKEVPLLQPEYLRIPEEVNPEPYCTRSGRFSREPDRLAYMLAGLELLD